MDPNTCQGEDSDVEQMWICNNGCLGLVIVFGIVKMQVRVVYGFFERNLIGFN